MRQGHYLPRNKKDEAKATSIWGRKQRGKQALIPPSKNMIMLSKSKQKFYIAPAQC